jgi:RNA polymerase sigma-70 factor (ECF subfamily)
MPIDSCKLGALLDSQWPILVTWIGGERTEAEDIVQQAFIKLAQEDPVPDNCRAWLFTVTKRLAINQQISRHKRQVREKSLACIQPNYQAAHATTEFEVLDLLNQLDSQERQVVIAKIWGGLTLAEIGSAIGASTASVWRIYRTGVAQLKELMGETQ